MGKTVNWPTGIGGKGNAGVAASVMKLSGSIGYVEYAYAKQKEMSHTGLISKAGKTVQPDAKALRQPLPVLTGPRRLGSA